MNDTSIIINSFFKTTVVFFICIAAASCKSSEGVKTDSSSSGPSNLEEKFWAQKESARMDFTEADVAFMIGMIGHHAQALIMSRLAPTHGAHEQVQTLAARIINAQKAEIASMQKWLRVRGQPVPEVYIEGLNLMIKGVENHHSGHMNMPGMLTQKQLEELDEANGIEFDRLFLTYMIQHHQGAVIMVDNLVSTPGAAQGTATFTLVSGINVDQQTEIDRMQRMLEELPNL